MKKIIYILIASMMFASCSESFLDVEPTKSIPVSQAFSTPKSVQAAITGVYYSLSNYKGMGRYNIMSAEVRGDDMMVPQRNNWNAFVSDYNYSYEPTSSYGNTIYLRAYEVIEGCNSILDADENGSITLDADVKNPLLAEVRAVRALCFYNLVRFFSKTYVGNEATPGIPVKVTADPSVLKGRGTVAEVYTQIVKDLEFAVQYLPVGTPMSDHVNKTYAQGLLASVYLTMGDKVKAAKYASDALIAQPYVADYANGMTQDNSTLIFRMEYTATTYAQYGALQSFYDFGFNDGGGYGTLGCTPTFYSKYEDGDIRQKWFLNQWVYSNSLGGTTYENFINIVTATEEDYNDYSNWIPRGLWEDGIGVSDASKDKLERRVWTPAGGFNSQVAMYGKFPRLDAGYEYHTAAKGAAGTTNLGHLPMLRTAELVLIKAEALATTAPALARVELNKILTGAGLADYAGTDADLLAAIWLERRKELLGEGERVFDIIRQKQIVTRSDYWGDSKYKTIDPTKDASKIILPIPKKEIDANSMMTADDQNPAYK